MIGTKFTTPNSKKDYVVIGEHHMFKNSYQCYPAEKAPPYKESLIEYFSIDFIENALKQNEDNYTK